ncbi:MAG: hypothetical protein EOP48_20310 [Sphingobacteriales bacterium]|nr:MAG: hypothetical protein EOP48_20310 [Sphingobacteriales bacterium]
MSAFLHPDNIDVFHQDYIKALTGKPSLVHRQITNGTEVFWRIIRYEPAYNNEGQIFGVIVNSTDITTQVEQKEKISSQHESLKEIAWIQSHKIRKPVATILGLLNLIDLEGHMEDIQELTLIQTAAYELDEKIRLIVGHANS